MLWSFLSIPEISSDLVFCFLTIDSEDPNKIEEKQASEAGESDEKRDKTKEELEKENSEVKEDEKKTPTKSKDLEPVPSKTKGPMVGVYTFCISNIS